MKEDIPADVKIVLQKLTNSSKHHLAAFQQLADGRQLNYPIGQNQGAKGMYRQGRGSGNQDCPNQMPGQRGNQQGKQFRNAQNGL
ncbi:MAG: hypothetical protein ACE3JP_15400 [Ectobacillus sp.]